MDEKLEASAHGRRHFSAGALVLGSAALASAAGLCSERTSAASVSEVGLIKIISILARKDGESMEDFVHHWETVHAPLVYAVPGVVRYTLSIVQSSSTRTDGVKPITVQIDGLAELWFKDYASLHAAASSEAIKHVLHDGAKFVGSEVDLIAVEKVIIPRAI